MFGTVAVCGQVRTLFQITAEKLHEFSSKLGVDYEEYFLECKRVLTKDGGDAQFVYGIENSHFVWKKIDPDNNIKVKFGSAKVKNIPFTDEGIKILSGSFSRVLRLSDALKAAEERKLKHDEEMKNLKQKLTKLCEEKDALEKELYVKFIAILNQKKEKIKSLEERCERGVLPKKGRSDLVHSSEAESDVDEPSSLTRRAPASTLSKRTLKTPPKNTDDRKQDPEARQTQASIPQASDCKDHYDSDTDVDTTTDDEKPTFDFVSSEPQAVATDDADDLFAETNSPPAVLPKRSRENAGISESEAGPSKRKSETNSLPVAEKMPKITQNHDFNSQDLFDDLVND
ncbi:DNA repair protein XRCC4-like isoform X2 [Bacillus rossius redtenbacheri]|uniref:DNA repair protein XRCC4-like isoform X2 n=1 Tax=Bacillus rossius redtenbacheri TaxID=93214 RepID=UPI002FDE83C2